MQFPKWASKERCHCGKAESGTSEVGCQTEFDNDSKLRKVEIACQTDINNDNSLDAGELKFMIWLVDGYEPDDRRIAKDLKLIDVDGDGTIDRIEWIKFLSMAGEGGGAFFDFDLKKLFDKHDLDKDGRVNLEEF